MMEFKNLNRFGTLTFTDEESVSLRTITADVFIDEKDHITYQVDEKNKRYREAHTKKYSAAQYGPWKALP